MIFSANITLPFHKKTGARRHPLKYCIHVICTYGVRKSYYHATAMSIVPGWEAAKVPVSQTIAVPRLVSTRLPYG